MADTVFVPKYPLRFRLGYIIMLVFAFIIVRAVFSGDRSFELLFLAGFSVLFLVVFPLLYIRRIVFKKNAFILERLLTGSKEVSYRDVLDIGTTAIKTRGRNIPINMISNSKELAQILQHQIESSPEDLTPLEGVLPGIERSARLASFLALITSLGVSFLLDLFFQVGQQIRFEWLFLIFFLIGFVVYYAILKNKAA